MNSKKILIIIGGPVVNMGSQAIVCGLVKNIRELYNDSYIEIIATDPDIGNGFKIAGVDHFSYRYSVVNNKINICRILNRLQRQITKKESVRLKMHNYINRARKADIVFIVGADNYDKSYNSLAYMNETNQFVEELGAEKFILYNCSMSEEDLTVKVIDDLKRFKYLTARDSISYHNMKKALPEKDVRFFPDVAFCMKPEAVALPEGWEEGNMIGINLSSLVMDGRYGVSEEETLKAYYSMIDYIIDNTEFKICLIPHVKKDADLSVLRRINAHVNNSDRVILINHENFNAPQKKYIISKCRLYVGARTHSTIAAYSSLVPTLVVGYSIKSIGIATDLLGTDKGNVIPVNELKNVNALRDAFINFIQRESEIRDKLIQTVPQYIAEAEKIKELIYEIVK